MEGDVDRIQIVGVGIVAGEYGGGETALERCKTEDGVVVAAENELNETVAESADAVVEEDGAGHGWVTSKTLATCEIKEPTLSLQETERQGWNILGDI